MLDAEAVNLQIGDCVSFVINEGLPNEREVTARVLQLPFSRKKGGMLVVVRQEGERKPKRSHRQQLVSVGRLRCINRPLLDPILANVYADWLEDHDEPRAAAKLREAFPIGN